MREDYCISQDKETKLIFKLAEELLKANFNASNTVIVTVSLDYSSVVGQLLRHALTYDQEICDGFGVDVPYPDESWDEGYILELDTILNLYKYKYENKKILFVEAGVIRGSNYRFLKEKMKGKDNVFFLSLFENESSVFKSDFVGEYYDNETQDLTFYWEEPNKHWI
jgi:hypothetical protein